MADSALKVFLVAGEESGDQLGAELMESLRAKSSQALIFEGVGGHAMKAAGLSPLFNMNEIAVMGFSAVLARLPMLLRRINQTAQAAIAAKPDIIVLIDSPDFTHRVAQKVKAALPKTPVVDFICPSVWAWRPGRAKKMAAYIDHVLAILPFEPKVLTELDGPPATYVGHPLIADVQATPNVLRDEQRTLLVLPGSRRGEITRLLPAFEEVINHLKKRRPSIELILPAVPHLKEQVEDIIASWAYRPQVVSGNQQKQAAFKKADAALAASGTVCLELALHGIPLVSTYKLDPIARQFRFLITTWTACLPNLIVDYPAVPEYIDDLLKPAHVARMLDRLLGATPERHAQLKAFKNLRDVMSTASVQTPSENAAEVILQVHQESVAKQH